jgi:hypothetical protein
MTLHGHVALFSRQRAYRPIPIANDATTLTRRFRPGKDALP